MQRRNGLGFGRVVRWVSAATVPLLGLIVLGCAHNTAPSDKRVASETKTEGKGQYADALAKLSDKDRGLVTEQGTCPVSGEPLGSMGTPLKVKAGDAQLWICCSGCENQVKQDPATYLAKIKE